MRWLAALILVLSGILVVTGAPPAAAASVQPGPGQFYGLRARALSNASIAAGATTTVKVAGVGAVSPSGVASAVASAAVNFAAKGASAAGVGGVPAFGVVYVALMPRPRRRAPHRPCRRRHRA
ncbi:hypothetical protein ACIBK9_13725 [Nonomuraea sp. NPDC050227]|uniref:hypothetical protein n=1 Tax=Nonomuraea sp. NPDC050227 TaxID=3364360 RepID=UPI0037B02F7C